MRRIRRLILGVLTFSVCAFGTGEQAPKEVTLQITEQAEKYVLTVPVSRLVMTIPKGGLTQRHNSLGGSADSPRYFFFEDDALHIIVSGWFESDDQFSGINKFWADEMAAWKQKNLPEAKDVSFENLGSWKAFLYDVEVPGNANSHIRAHWVQHGTWIDLHLSLTSSDSQKQRREKLRNALKAIQVSEKKT
jgi:hypothetical protein